MQPASSFPPISASPAHSRKAWAGAAMLGLMLGLAGCNSSPAPLSQPLDAGVAPMRGPELAQNAEHPPHPAGPQTPAVPAPPPTPNQAANAASHVSDDPSQPMSADPQQDAGGFDPAPQNDLDSGSAGGGQENNRSDGPHT